MTFCQYCASDERVDNTRFPPRCEVHGDLEAMSEKRVYVSQGWKAVAYHRTRSCRWLKKGQASVAAYGGAPANIVMVSLLVAEGRGLAPCQHCC